MDHRTRDQRMDWLTFGATATLTQHGNIQPRRRNKGPVKKPPDRPQPLPDSDRDPVS
jgi:hypothetical protein